MKYKDIKEANMGLNVTASGTRTVPTLEGAKELVVTSRFWLRNNTSAFSRAQLIEWTATKGDKIFNLPGGIFWKPKGTKLPKSFLHPDAPRNSPQYGYLVTRNKDNIRAIVANSKVVK